MKDKSLIVLLAAMLLFSLAACGKAQSPDEGDLSAPTSTQAKPSDESETPTDEGSSADKDTSAEATDTHTENETWKTEFEQSLMENYGVKPDHYEDLGDGVYQVYVEIDGKAVPYVAVDSATGDYHG